MRYSLIANINVIIMKHNIIKINDVEIPKVGQAFHQPLGVREQMITPPTIIEPRQRLIYYEP